jgi:hypothetical protein
VEKIIGISHGGKGMDKYIDIANSVLNDVHRGSVVLQKDDAVVIMRGFLEWARIMQIKAPVSPTCLMMRDFFDVTLGECEHAETQEVPGSPFVECQFCKEVF